MATAGIMTAAIMADPISPVRGLTTAAGRCDLCRRLPARAGAAFGFAGRRIIEELKLRRTKVRRFRLVFELIGELVSAPGLEPGTT